MHGIRSAITSGTITPATETEHIAGMASKLERFDLNAFEQIGGNTKDSICSYTAILRNAIDQADYVYAFRSHNHLPEQTPLTAWCDDEKNSELEKIEIDFKQFDRVFELKSSDGSAIRKINLDKKRDAFRALFRISIRDFRSELESVCGSCDMLIDDPLYDQFDFLFVKNGKIMLWTDIHELLLFIVK